MIKITRGPAWTIREPASPKASHLPFDQEDRDKLVHSLNERGKADRRVEFEQRFDWRGWWVILRFGRVAGRLECIGMDVLRDPDATERAPMTSLAIRNLPFGRFVQEARSWYRETQEKPADPGAGTWAPQVSDEQKEAIIMAARADARERLRLLRSETTDRRLGRPRLYGSEHFELVAEIYTEVWIDGGNPTAAVAERFGVSRSAAAKWVARAREMGLLPPTTKGKPSG